MLSGFAIISNAVAKEDVVEIEDKPIPFDSAASEQTQTTFIQSWFDGLLVSSIAIAGSFVVYFVINHFLKRTEDSLRLYRRDLKGSAPS